MSNQTKQRSTNTAESSPQSDAGASAVLADARAKTNLLFATAAKNFEAMSESDSQEFVKNSRQTGGQ